MTMELIDFMLRESKRSRFKVSQSVMDGGWIINIHTGIGFWGRIACQDICTCMGGADCWLGILACFSCSAHECVVSGYTHLCQILDRKGFSRALSVGKDVRPTSLLFSPGISPRLHAMGSNGRYSGGPAVS